MQVLLPALADAGVRLVRRTEFTRAEREWAAHYFAQEVRPLLTPIGLDPAHPFPQVVNKSLNFIVELAGKDAFEFGTMLSFAIPGTVIGVSYVIAFNVPPIELTGTGVILVIAFIFRNMPVGVRAGEIDPMAVEVLDEIGIDASRHKSKKFDQLEDGYFDLIITLSPEAQHRAVEMTRTMACDVEFWNTFDPQIVEGTRDQRMDAYRMVRDQLMRRIKERFPLDAAPKV